jgi:plastocyanin
VKRAVLGLSAVSLLLHAVPATAGPATVVVATVAGNQFAPPMVNSPQGATLMVVQLDPVARHDLVSRAIVRRKPMFTTGRSLTFGEALTVQGVEKLKPASYAFVCTIHDGMMGQLIVH